MQTWAAATERTAVSVFDAGAPPVDAAAPCWLIVHELRDATAAALAAALQAPAAARGFSVRTVSVTALTGYVQWGLRVESQGTRCSLRAPTLALMAGAAAAAPGLPDATPWVELAGVMNRCGPVQWPAGVADADYKSAEWNALLAAWLHGLPCPVVNRPLAHRLHAALQSPAVWRQAAAARGLPVWPWSGGSVGGPGGAVHAPAANGSGEGAGLLVVGGQVFEAPGESPVGWSSAAHRAAVLAARDCGCQLLAWQGRADAQGHWRITAANPWPDLGPFGPAAVAALADALSPTAPPQGPALPFVSQDT